MFFKLLLIFILVKSHSGISISEVVILFGEKHCIPGTWDSLVEVTHSLEENQNILIEPLQTYTTSDNEKSAMTAIHELAQYNDIRYSYELIKDEGPPHNKIFSVMLYLGDEKYTSEGKTIKKAQQLAANTALKGTGYVHPPVKLKEGSKSLTPTVLLNNLASKLGLPVGYKLVTDNILELGNENEDIQFMPKKSYLQKLNETAHLNDSIRVRKDGGDITGPFTVRVDVAGNSFFGKSDTIQSAKHEAARTALKSLKENDQAFYCLNEGDNCKSKKQSIKSGISLVYEAAQLRNLDVSFEVVDETGPSHKKIFTTKCVIGDLEATGEGRSKKESKRLAAESILPGLLKIPEVKEKPITNLEESKKFKKRKKKNKVIKTTLDKIDRLFDEVVDFGKGLVDNIVGHKEEPSKDNLPSKNDKSDKGSRRSPTEEIIQLAKLLNLNVKFNDFTDSSKSYALLDLGTKPSFLCLGEGINQKNARDLAATYGVHKIYTLGLLENLLDKSKEISDVLDKEEYYANFWLEVVDDQEKEL